MNFILVPRARAQTAAATRVAGSALAGPETSGTAFARHGESAKGRQTGPRSRHRHNKHEASALSVSTMRNFRRLRSLRRTVCPAMKPRPSEDRDRASLHAQAHRRWKLARAILYPPPRSSAGRRSRSRAPASRIWRSELGAMDTRVEGSGPVYLSQGPKRPG